MLNFYVRFDTANLEPRQPNNENLVGAHAAMKTASPSLRADLHDFRGLGLWHDADIVGLQDLGTTGVTEFKRQ